MENVNLINKELWDAAEWKEIGFLVTHDLDSQPGIALVFKNIEAGISIFEEWRKVFGEADRNEFLRVSLITGTHPTRGEGYSLHFSTDISSRSIADSKENARYVLAGSRWFFKETRGQNDSLDWFRASYEKYKMYFLIPVPAGVSDLSPFLGHMLGKTRIYLRDYSDIEADDQDSVVLD